MMSCGRFAKNGGMKSFQIFFKEQMGTLAVRKNTLKPFQYSHFYSVHSVKERVARSLISNQISDMRWIPNRALATRPLFCCAVDKRASKKQIMKKEYKEIIEDEDKVGVAIILCNEFKKVAREVEEVFKNLEFSTKFMEDASKEDIRDIVKIAAEAEYPENYKFVFYSISHGNHDNGKEYIYVANGGKVYIEEDITDKFQPGEATGIQAMPKLFFFDNCRGGITDPGIEKPAMGLQAQLSAPTLKMPGKGNMLVAYSTHPGFGAEAILQTNGFYKPIWSKFLMKQLPIDQSIYAVLQKTNAFLKEEFEFEIIEKNKMGDFITYQAPIFYSSLSGEEIINLYKEADEKKHQR